VRREEITSLIADSSLTQWKKKPHLPGGGFCGLFAVKKCVKKIQKENVYSLEVLLLFFSRKMQDELEMKFDELSIADVNKQAINCT